MQHCIEYKNSKTKNCILYILVESIIYIYIEKYSIFFLLLYGITTQIIQEQIFKIIDYFIDIQEQMKEQMFKIIDYFIF